MIAFLALGFVVSISQALSPSEQFLTGVMLEVLCIFPQAD
jgi:hypothetical protein